MNKDYHRLMSFSQCHIHIIKYKGSFYDIQNENWNAFNFLHSCDKWYVNIWQCIMYSHKDGESAEYACV